MKSRIKSKQRRKGEKSNAEKSVQNRKATGKKIKQKGVPANSKKKNDEKNVKFKIPKSRDVFLLLVLKIHR